jgi:membrane protein implicated in regulation of membrane protease activity
MKRIIVVVVMLLLVGCITDRFDFGRSNTPEADEPPVETQEDVNNVGSVVSDVRESISADATGQAKVNIGIRNETKEIEGKDPEKRHAKPIKTIRTLVDKSDKVVESMRGSAVRLEETKGELVSVSVKVGKLESGIEQRDEIIKKKDSDIKKAEEVIAKLNKRLDDETNKSRVLLNKFMMALLAIGFMGLAFAGYTAFVSPSKITIGLAGGGVVLIIASLTVMFYFEKLVFVGFVAFAVMVIFAVYTAYKHIKEREEKEKTEEALEGAVRVAEIMKGEVDPKVREEIFGRKHDNGRAGTLQTKDAMIRIRKIRERMHLEDGPTIK